MTDKRTLILQTADKLFVEQGIKNTTIAQIAELAGIAKGSVYSYFKSKLDIVKALFVQSFERSQQAAEALLADQRLHGPALLEAHVMSQLHQVEEERAFQQMWMSDDSLVMDDDLLQLIQTCRAEFCQVQLAILQRALGDDASPWRYDLLTLINGQIQEFSLLITMDNMTFSHVHCAAFISRSACWTLNGVQQSQSEPVLTEQIYVINPMPGDRQSQIQRILKQLRSLCIKLDSDEQTLVSQTLDLIEQQSSLENPSVALLRALIANLRPYPELAEERARLAELLAVELI
ncbi:TetR/AcrR family transcriptional regulator [Bowmanella denitrificans]|uniref:TetR/AcrR family transcriptional regulator n=1 Tax=Bowmanella denitrificans TaxID=366582 RepID=UPI000C99DB58|nr:TetR/AcrR family transcriptional regulator [Bowmanella denitrificans]